MHVAYKAGHDTVVEELASRGGRANFNWRANGETFDDGPPSSLEEIMGIEKGEVRQTDEIRAAQRVGGIRGG